MYTLYIFIIVFLLLNVNRMVSVQYGTLIRIIFEHRYFAFGV